MSNIPTQAVRIAKYLCAHGCTVRRFTLTSDGRSAYIKASIGTRRFTVRISDHKPHGGRSHNTKPTAKLLSFCITQSWSFIRSRLTYIMIRHATSP